MSRKENIEFLQEIGQWEWMSAHDILLTSGRVCAVISLWAGVDGEIPPEKRNRYIVYSGGVALRGFLRKKEALAYCRVMGWAVSSTAR